MEQPFAVAEVGPVPRSLWERVRAEPERAPEHIALAAAERFAAPAEAWAEEKRAHHRSPAALARSAFKAHVRLARLEGLVAGLGGAFTVVPDLAALAWIQGRMVYYIAAAYGFDPRHPMRPAELLTLQGIYPTPAEARRALDGLGTPLAVQYVKSRRGDEQLARRLVKLVGRKAAKRAILKTIPGLSSPVSAIQNGGATADLGARALRYYGG